MASDLRAAILAKLDELAADHQPCDPGADCLHRAVDAVRALLERHRPDGEFCGECDWVRPCSSERAIAEALGIRDAAGARLEAGQC